METSSSKNGADKKSDWTQYEDEAGQSYWFNRVTNVSTWDKPDELKSEFEKEEKTVWREYVDDEGRKYYNNSKTEETTWNMPEEYRLFLERLEDRRKKAVEALETPMERMLKTVYPDEPLKQQFAFLLVVDRHMLSSWTWDQCHSATFEDERSKLLKMADRKQVYQLLVQKLKNFEFDERKRKERQILDDFHSMLDSWPEIDRYTTYREMCEHFDSHQAIASVIGGEKERIRLFNDYKQTKERKAREVSKIAYERKMEQFKHIMVDAKLSPQTSWKDFLDQHSSHPLFHELEPLDRIQAFYDHIRHLERSEDEHLAAERRKSRTLARKAREAFRSLLIEKFSSHHTQISSSSHHNATMDSTTNWRKFLPIVSNEPRYQAMLNISGSTPAELFFDYIVELQERFIKERKKVKHLAKSLGLRVLRFTASSSLPSDANLSPRPENLLNLTLEGAPKWDFKTWCQKLRNHVSTVDENTLRRIYNDFGARELSKMQGRVARAHRHFTSTLKSKITDPNTSYDAIKSIIPHSIEYDIISEQEKMVLFHSVIQTFTNPQETHPTTSSEINIEENPANASATKGRGSKRSHGLRDSHSYSDDDSDDSSRSDEETSSPNKSRKLKEGTTPDQVDPATLPPRSHH
jgi:hypothetical protein